MNNTNTIMAAFDLLGSSSDKTNSLPSQILNAMDLLLKDPNFQKKLSEIRTTFKDFISVFQFLYKKIMEFPSLRKVHDLLKKAMDSSQCQKSGKEQEECEESEAHQPEMEEKEEVTENDTENERDADLPPPCSSERQFPVSNYELNVNVNLVSCVELLKTLTKNNFVNNNEVVKAIETANMEQIKPLFHSRNALYTWLYVVHGSGVIHDNKRWLLSVLNYDLKQRRLCYNAQYKSMRIEVLKCLYDFGMGMNFYQKTKLEKVMGVKKKKEEEKEDNAQKPSK